MTIEQQDLEYEVQELMDEIDKLRAAMKECLASYYHELGYMPWCISVIDQAYNNDDSWMEHSSTLKGGDND